MRIALVIVKNTSTLDYTLPLLWQIRRRHPDATLSVLYCSLDKRAILRRSRYYDDVCAANRIDAADLIDAWQPTRGALGDGMRRLLAYNWWDSQSEGNALDVLRSGVRVASRLGAELAGHVLPLGKALDRLAPDIVLFDNRTRTRFPGRDDVYAYFDAARRPVMLLPHAPHQTRHDDFIPFDAERNVAVADYTRYWYPFRLDEPWVRAPGFRPQFDYTGYPGFDSDWLDATLAGGITGATPAVRSGPLRALFIIREFRGLHSGRPGDQDPYILEEREFRYYSQLLAGAVADLRRPVNVIVKPHPSNNFRTLGRAMETLGLSHWQISYESVYALMPQIDFVVSLYSTTLLAPALAGIPVMLLNTRMQRELHQWEPMQRMYGGMEFYLENPEDARSRLGDVAAIAEARRSDPRMESRDVVHLRDFYPDDATRLCLASMGLR